ncbi:DUF6207 family protein [Streptomyces sp. V4I2]|uniref:DUF6207 family protein n=1 Tax=Streptomyces sp. V4I2 TaxID=3042280 RepID=UPI0027D891FB|nr:DUF6207 family protein [Streptomyces sp. V4I2]
MDPIQETHLSEPGLLVIDVAGRDDDTVNTFQSALARTWATAIDRTTRDPGQPGVRVRMYVDLRQGLAETLRRSGLWSAARKRPGPSPRGE